MIEEILEQAGEQITWEFLKSEGKWYVWASNDEHKVSEADESLQEATRLTAIGIARALGL